MPVKRHFKNISLVFLLLAAGTILYMAISGAQQTPTVNKENTAPFVLPEVVVVDGTETPVTLEVFTGQVVLVNLWATWCPPCVVELPSLDSLQARFKDNGFKVVAISMDRSSLDIIKNFLRERDIHFLDVYWDRDNEIPMKWKYRGLPTSFLIDRAGNVVETFDGPYDWSKGAVFEKIKVLVEKP